MGADRAKSPTELEQYLTLLRQRDEAGLPYAIVGGHAVNFWAKLYLDREPRLDPVLLLAGKIRNAVEIEQNQPAKPRQYVKHAAMLALDVQNCLHQLIGARQSISAPPCPDPTPNPP